VEPHGQKPVAPAVRRNPPKLQSSFAKASEDTRLPQQPGSRGFLRRRVKTWGMSVAVHWKSKRHAADSKLGPTLETALNALEFQAGTGIMLFSFFEKL